MREWLTDLYAHQVWADDAIRQRLHHLHFVQHAFLWTVGDRAQPFRMTKPDDFASFESLRGYAQEFHAPTTAYIFWLWKGRPRPAW